jgi:hypothetical protein
MILHFRGEMKKVFFKTVIQKKTPHSCDMSQKITWDFKPQNSRFHTLKNGF